MQSNAATDIVMLHFDHYVLMVETFVVSNVNFWRIKINLQQTL